MKKCLLSLCLFVNACATWDQDRFYTENGKNKYIVVEDEHRVSLNKHSAPSKQALNLYLFPS